jgi:hypothetical protein
MMHFFLFYFDKELDCVQSVEETFPSAQQQSDGFAFSFTFGEAYFYLFDLESNKLSLMRTWSILWE